MKNCFKTNIAYIADRVKCWRKWHDNNKACLKIRMCKTSVSFHALNWHHLTESRCCNNNLCPCPNLFLSFKDAPEWHKSSCLPVLVLCTCLSTIRGPPLIIYNMYLYSFSYEIISTHFSPDWLISVLAARETYGICLDTQRVTYRLRLHRHTHIISLRVRRFRGSEHDERHQFTRCHGHKQICTLNRINVLWDFHVGRP